MNKNHMIMKKAVATMMVATLGLSTAACGTGAAMVNTEAVEEEDALAKGDAEKLEEVLNSTSFGTADKENTKMETVYVTSSATGSTQNVIVTDWLRNYEGTDTLVDSTTLQDIENVKGNQTYTENSDGTITWAADGNDIYYQGTTNETLPVGVKVSYKLDGKDITPEELAGKSGKVTIRFDYTNNARETVTINGKEQKITVPFAMVSGMILPTDKFTNIDVTNGKVISDASSNIVMGVALPGLREALNVDEDQLEDLGVDVDSKIPEYVEITADTTDFELGMTMTLASCDVLSDLGFTDFSNTDAVARISDDMDLLQDSMGQLMDGSAELKDGAVTLRNGVYTLKDGVKEYTDGVGKLTDGAKTLNDNMGTLTSGTQALADGTKQLKDALAGADLSSIQNLLQQYAAIHNALTTGGFATDYNGATNLAKMKADGSLASMQSDAAALQTKYAEIQNTAAATTNDVIGNGVYSAAVAKVQAQLTAAAGTEVSQEQAAAVTATALAMTANGAEATPEMLQSDAFAANVKMVTAVGNLEKITTQEITYLKGLDVDVDALKEETSASDAELAFAVYLAQQNGAIPEDASKEAVVGAAKGYLEASKKAIQSVGAAQAADKSSQKTQLGVSTYTTAFNTVKAGAAMQGTELSDENAELIVRYGIANALKAQSSDFTTYISQASTELSEMNTKKQQMEAVQASLRTADQASAIAATRGWEKVSSASDLSESNQTWLGLTGMTYDEWKYISTWSVCTDTEKNTAAEYIAKYTAFETKYQMLTSTANQLTTQIGALKVGVDKLDAGATQLNNSVKTLLAPGVLSLYNGAVLIDSNSQKLVDGTISLADGTDQLVDGLVTLSDGLLQFDEEGVEKLVEAFDGDITEFNDRLVAIDEAATTYQTFSGAADDMTSSVKFIIETDGVEVEE